MNIFGKQVRRRNWLVAYTLTHGHGRVVITSDDDPLSRQLLLYFEHWIQAANPNVAQRQPTACVFSIQPLDAFWETEKEKPHGIE